MSYLIVPNIICFQTQKQLTPLNNIWYYIYMHVNSYMQKHLCMQLACTLVNVRTICQVLPTVSFLYQYDVIIWRFLDSHLQTFLLVCVTLKEHILFCLVKLLSQKRLWMSYLIVPNVICFQTQKQLATLHNIWYYIYMHVNSCMQKHLCVHLACTLVKVRTICRALPTASFLYQYDVIIWWFLDSHAQSFLLVCVTLKEHILFCLVKLLSRKRLWMSYLIVPNIIAFRHKNSSLL